ncbi:hypothetical protein ACTXT7_003110 [Hymenolepis weldensis]
MMTAMAKIPTMVRTIAAIRPRSQTVCNATEADQMNLAHARAFCEVPRATDRVASKRGRACRGLSANQRSTFVQRIENCTKRPRS